MTLLVSTLAVAEPALTVENAWMREAPPSAKALAGYMTITTSRSTPVKLVRAESPLFDKVEFHVTEFEGGMMRMKHLESLVISRDEPAEFEPGGRHLMLMNPQKRLLDGDNVPITLHLEGGSTITVNMIVRK